MNTRTKAVRSASSKTRNGRGNSFREKGSVRKARIASNKYQFNEVGN